MTMSRWLSSVFVLGLGLWAAPSAHAQSQKATAAAPATDPGADEVLLKNGGVLRGTVVSLDPGNEVSILVAGSGKPRVVPWGEVANVERGKFAPGGAAPPPAAPGYPTPAPIAPQDAAASPDSPGVVRLHIEATEPGVKLVEEVSATYGMVGGYGFALQELREVCAAPCDQVIDGRRGQSFFFAGDDIPASDSFTLASYRGDLQASVDAGSVGLAAGGWTLILTGGTAMLLSPVFFLIGALETTDYDYTTGESTSEPMASWGIPVGGVMLGVGTGMLVGGIVMAAMSGTDFELGEGGGSTPAAPRAARTPRYWLGEF
jgi:hypothetical protein